MSIELKQAAEKALEALQLIEQWDSEGLMLLDHHNRIAKNTIAELSAAIQQAKAKTDEPAAVRNPFASRCYTMSESHLSGHRLIVGFEKLEDAQSAHEWVARCGRSNPGELPGMWHESELIGGETDCEPSRPPHTAPGAPDDVVRDAERYRWLRSLEHCNEAWCFIGSGNANSNLDAAIDAAMLTAAQAQKGQP